MKRSIFVIVLLLAAMCGCATITPEELYAFKTKTALVKELSARCAEEPDKCCTALAESARAMETVITAIED